MGIYKRIQSFKPVLKNMNRDICVISKNGRTDYFYITVNHNNINRDIFARLFMINDKWYVWYEKLCCRLSVPSFTAGMNLVEGEILRCEV